MQYLQEVDSTNTALKRMALQGAAHGTVLVAEKQAAGHGRFGRVFFSPQGGLYMSVLLRDVSAEQAGLVTVAAAVAAAEAAEQICGLPVDIKWVNDLYLHGKKVCGILAESVPDLQSGRMHTVVGFGVNIAPPQGGFSPELAEIAGALLPAPQAGARDVLAADVAARFLRYAAALSEREFLAGYRSRMMLTGKQVEYLKNGVSQQGTVLGVDDDGALLVRGEDGDQRLVFGEVTMHKE